MKRGFVPFLAGLNKLQFDFTQLFDFPIFDLLDGLRRLN